MSAKVVTGTVRFSYLNVFRKSALDEKYSVTLLIPKDDKKTLNAIRKAIDTAKREGIKEKWKGKEPRDLWNPLRDGDEEKADEHPEYAGMYFLKAKSDSKPILLDEYKDEILDETELYSGCWGRANINFFAFDNNTKGVSAGLNALQKKRDDDAFGGRVTLDEARTSFDEDNDEDDMLG
ncbi:MAG TPA: DUF2815 domain-containing protein [Lachnospiraceae bacterium]|jgi:hypothetical protein|uniref:Uncharacterized protein DUF2815 n=1 Tax=Muricomes intestini TaxID=1796634 RepID=A0A4R3K6X2_9FIRM|nr:DUF2815 family protein [Muricomes intestini]TCS78508.1 uncharacterized protein DUF2815 [Muricomes intestini]HCR83888.1 DUF2815 domain-containing protein [Lachnospiraceae bacterium]